MRRNRMGALPGRISAALRDKTLSRLPPVGPARCAGQLVVDPAELLPRLALRGEAVLRLRLELAVLRLAAREAGGGPPTWSGRC